ncbi:MAG: hypothetical protein DCC55_34385 [Chloroflexi bacterium]|nr:MAG: hypothetical protein DCC55_34385 [Chloroflexota bacterium]
MVQLSFGISGSKAIGDYIELAGLAEGYGFHTLSIFDDLMFKPAWPILYVVAQQTQRIRVGPSVSNPYLIHPAILAEQAALLDEISGGRAYLGIGRGAFLDLVQVTPEKPIAGVREAVEIARQLWRGEKRVYDGKVFQLSADAHLHWQPLRNEIPVMIGTWGPRMCRMAGAIANEVKAGAMWSAEYGQFMWTHIAEGARAAGRNPAEVGLVFGPLTSVSTDRQQAKAFARRTLAFYLPYLSPMTDHLGIGPEEVAYAQAAAARGDFEAAISQRVLDHFALYGAPHDIIEQIERMAAETHVTRIEFGMPHGPDGSVEALHLLGKQVVPHFAKS